MERQKFGPGKRLVIYSDGRRLDEAVVLWETESKVLLQVGREQACKIEFVYEASAAAWRILFEASHNGQRKPWPMLSYEFRPSSA